jgi:hypothetical protein
VIGRFKAMQTADVHLPTTDGRELVLSRYTQPEAHAARPIAPVAARAAAAEDHRQQSPYLCAALEDTFQ